MRWEDKPVIGGDTITVPVGGDVLLTDGNSVKMMLKGKVIKGMGSWVVENGWNGPDAWPDWQDVGRRVDMLMDDGLPFSGVLSADEFWTGEEEIPVFSVMLDSGDIVSFAEHNRWRFSDIQ